MNSINGVRNLDNNIDFRSKTANPQQLNAVTYAKQKIIDKLLNSNFCAQFMSKSILANFTPKIESSIAQVAKTTEGQILIAKKPELLEQYVKSKGIEIKSISVYRPFSSNEGFFDIHFTTKDGYGTFFGDHEQLSIDKLSSLTSEESLKKQFVKAINDNKIQLTHKYEEWEKQAGIKTCTNH